MGDKERKKPERRETSVVVEERLGKVFSSMGDEIEGSIWTEWRRVDSMADADRVIRDEGVVGTTYRISRVTVSVTVEEQTEVVKRVVVTQPGGGVPDL